MILSVVRSIEADGWGFLWTAATPGDRVGRLAYKTRFKKRVRK
jgi:hypothetical protein